MVFRFVVLTAAWLLCPAGAKAQHAPPPAQLHRFMLERVPQVSTAWEHWRRMKKPAKIFLPPPQYDFGMAFPSHTPSVLEDDPFDNSLKVYNRGMYLFGISGAKGFSLRNPPRNFRQWLNFLSLRSLRKLLHLRNWIPQPESPSLQQQNLIGASFYFYF